MQKEELHIIYMKRRYIFIKIFEKLITKVHMNSVTNGKSALEEDGKLALRARIHPKGIV